MSTNSSSSLNDTHLLPPFLMCLESLGSTVIYIMYTFINILVLLPLYILVLHVGFQRWRRGHARQTVSYSDFFTYHMVAVEILGSSGMLVYCVGLAPRSAAVILSGVYMFVIIFPGQTAFHLLTCVERYLAVVHPIAYMRLRTKARVRIRNVAISCAWLSCFAWVGLTKLYLPGVPTTPLLCILGISVVVIAFCCLSVLHALAHPAPGEGGGDREQVDPSKRRAFHIISIIMGALSLRFAGLMVTFSLSYLQWIHEDDLCAFMDLGILLNMPSSLVLPLLFLHKAGKLACCKSSEERYITTCV